MLKQTNLAEALVMDKQAKLELEMVDSNSGELDSKGTPTNHRIDFGLHRFGKVPKCSASCLLKFR